MTRYRYDKTSGAITEQSVSIPIMDDLIDTTLNNRANRMAIQLLDDMNMSLYGPRRSYTQSQRIMMRLDVYRQRIVDAWLVLTGRADIGDW